MRSMEEEAVHGSGRAEGHVAVAVGVDCENGVARTGGHGGLRGAERRTPWHSKSEPRDVGKPALRQAGARRSGTVRPSARAW